MIIFVWSVGLITGWSGLLFSEVICSYMLVMNVWSISVPFCIFPGIL